MAPHASTLDDVQALKLRANALLKENHLHDADAAYTAALEALNALCESADLRDVPPEKLNETAAVILSNRAMTRLKLEEYGWAINDATEALARCPSYFKAYYRRGCAKYAIGRYKDALSDFRAVERVRGGDKDNAAKLKDCEKRVREEAFAKAIAEEAAPPLSDSFDINSLPPVDSSYKGPRLLGEEQEVEEPEQKQKEEELLVSQEFANQVLEWFRKQEKLPVRYAVRIVLAARKMFSAMPNIVHVGVAKGREITVCGDTHGQFYDLLRIFEQNGAPSSTNPYVFNGDFVDRGSFSVEVILTLLVFKLLDSQCMHLTRGNHESLSMNKIYGFEGEVKAKYSETVFKLFLEMFRKLPLAYVLDGTGASTLRRHELPPIISTIAMNDDGGDDDDDGGGGGQDEAGGKRVMVVHGGLFSRDGVTLGELQRVERDCEPDTGLMAEMLWSDPQKENGWGASKRGVGVAFGPDVTERFLDANGLQTLVRSHEMKDDGYEVEANGRLITIFSAPNYCDQMGNKGAWIRFGYDMVPKFTQFEAAPHPEIKAMAYAPNLGMYGLM